jgi:hypothetical protein
LAKVTQVSNVAHGPLVLKKRISTLKPNKRFLVHTLIFFSRPIYAASWSQKPTSNTDHFLRNFPSPQCSDAYWECWSGHLWWGVWEILILYSLCTAVTMEIKTFNFLKSYCIFYSKIIFLSKKKYYVSNMVFPLWDWLRKFPISRYSFFFFSTLHLVRV